MSRWITRLALAAGLALGGATLTAQAAPLATGAAAPAATAEALRGDGMATVGHRSWHRPRYRTRRVYRPVYRAGPRVVCTTRYRTVYRPGWGYVRRPVRVCQRRW